MLTIGKLKNYLEGLKDDVDDNTPVCIDVELNGKMITKSDVFSLGIYSGKDENDPNKLIDPVLVIKANVSVLGSVDMVKLVANKARDLEEFAETKDAED